MSTEDLIGKLGELEGNDLLREVTVRYVFSLHPALSDAVFRCAVLRWFTPEVLEGVLGVGTISTLAERKPEQEMDNLELFEQLKNLRFAENYSGDSYSFHDITRELILDHLWKNEPDFYKKVSAQAAAYFDHLLKLQGDLLDRGEVEFEQINWDLGVDWCYHYIIANEDESIDVINGFLNNLLDKFQVGTFHAVVQTLSEHSAAGRLSNESQTWLRLWRLDEALANYDYAGLKKMTEEILQLEDIHIPPWLKPRATYKLAYGLINATQYEEAETYLKQIIDKFIELEDYDGYLQVVIALGDLEYYRSNHDEAIDYYAAALEAHVTQLRIPASDDSEDEDDTPLKIFYPNSWHRRELELQEPEDGEAVEGEESLSQPEEDEEFAEELILYFIDYDMDQSGIDAADLSEEDSFETMWPIEFDNILAVLWLNFGYIYSSLSQYDLAADCSRLAGQIFSDLDNLVGLQSAVRLLRSLGASIGDLEYVKELGDFQDELLSAANNRRDPMAFVSGLIDRGYDLLEIDQYQASQASFEEALATANSINLTNSIATCLDGLARLSWIRSDYDKAEGQFNEALKLYEETQNRGGRADSLISLGGLQQARKQLNKAESTFQKALKIYEELGNFSGQFRSLLNLSEVALLKCEIEDSFRFLNQALHLSQAQKGTQFYSQAEALYKTATLYLASGQYDKSQDLYDQAVKIADQIGNKQLLVNLFSEKADILSKMTEYTKAVTVYDQVLQIDPENTAAMTGKVWALENSGKEYASEGKSVCEEIVRLRPKDWWAHKSIANALRLSGDLQGAADQYEWVVKQIVESGMQTEVDSSTFAWCQYQLGNFGEAEGVYRQLVGSESETVSDFFDLGLVLLCSEKFSESLQVYQQGIEILKKICPPLTRLSWLAVALEDMQEAFEKYPKLTDADARVPIQDLLKEQQKLARTRNTDFSGDQSGGG